jgi:1-acyl-sn-glycerol-3-phosphate acyltransferase
MDNYYKTLKLIFRIFHLVTFQDCRVYGNLDVGSGAKIIAGNHPNATDGFYLLSIFKEQLHFFAQDDLFDIPFVGWLFTHSGQIRVFPDQKKLAVEQAINYLEQDKVVAIFPEARLNPDGQPGKSHTGAIRLALATRAPIIPIGFYVPSKNLHHISRMKKGEVSQGHWQTHGHCYLHIGSPWLIGEEAAQSVGGADIPGLTVQLMDKINGLAQLAMEEYVNETGSTANLASFNKQR